MSADHRINHSAPWPGCRRTSTCPLGHAHAGSCAPVIPIDDGGGAPLEQAAVADSDVHEVPPQVTLHAVRHGRHEACPVCRAYPGEACTAFAASDTREQHDDAIAEYARAHGAVGPEVPPPTMMAAPMSVREGVAYDRMRTAARAVQGTKAAHEAAMRELHEANLAWLTAVAPGKVPG